MLKFKVFVNSHFEEIEIDEVEEDVEDQLKERLRELFDFLVEVEEVEDE